MYSTSIEIAAGLAAVVSRHGPWTAHDVALGFGMSTMGRGQDQQWRVDYFKRLIEQYSQRVLGGGAYLI